jgi:hypothetical protein
MDTALLKMLTRLIVILARKNILNFEEVQEALGYDE